jgi:hypothetical protein
MRRTASEVLRSLEMRVARLEKQAGSNLDGLLLNAGFTKHEDEGDVTYTRADPQYQISVAVGSGNYSNPREDGASRYTAVEVAFLRNGRFIRPDMADYGQHRYWEGELYAYLPIKILCAMLGIRR